MPYSIRVPTSFVLRFIQALRRRDHDIHNWVIFGASCLAISSCFSLLPKPAGTSPSTILVEFALSRFHLDWKTIIGLSLLTTYAIGNPFLNWRYGSVPIGKLPKKGGVIPPKVSVVRVTETNVDMLARFSSEVYPKTLISEQDFLQKSQMYRRWLKEAPEFARLIMVRDGEIDEVRGISVLLPITQATFAAYRNGNGKPDAWIADQIAKDSEKQFLFLQAIHCLSVSGLDKTSTSSLLGTVFVQHFHAIGGGIRAPVLIAPIKTKAGRRNMVKLGFEMFKYSGAGFQVWELDGRRIQDFSPDGVETLNTLREYSP